MTRLDPRALALAVERERGRRSLAWFVRHAWPLVEQTEYRHNWHIDLICAHLEACYRGDVRKLCINVPPGSMKSLLVGVFWNAWLWIQDPSLALFYTSFDGELTARDAAKVQTILTSEWFLDRWGARVQIDLNEPTRGFNTYVPDGKTGKLRLAGGWRHSSSVDGKATGRHPDIKIIDDPTKPKEATKENLEKSRTWYQNTFRSRQRDPATVRSLLIMQRLDEDDLAGYLLAHEGDWAHIRIPLEYEPKSPLVTPYGSDPRTEEGESFWLNRFPPQVIREIKRDTPDVGVYSSQYQQDPTPAGGIVFAADWLTKRWTTLPESGVWILSADFAFKGETDSDFVVLQCWLQHKANYYLVDQYRKRMGFTESLQAFQDFARKWPKAIGKLIEDKANGPAIMSALSGKVSGLLPVEPYGSKLARARAVQPLLAAGDVYLPNAEWTLDFVREVTGFPRAKNDDQVDTMTQALSHLSGKGGGKLSAAMGRWREVLG